MSTRKDKLIKQKQRLNFQAIESEVRYYHQLKQQYEESREEIFSETSLPEIPGGAGYTSDTTLSKVIRLTSLAAIKETERRINAIEYALEQIKLTGDPARIRLVQLKYFENRLTDQGIMQELGMSRDTFYRWRRQFVEVIANHLGWDVGQKDYKRVSSNKKKKANL